MRVQNAFAIFANASNTVVLCEQCPIVEHQSLVSTCKSSQDDGLSMSQVSLYTQSARPHEWVQQPNLSLCSNTMHRGWSLCCCDHYSSYHHHHHYCLRHCQWCGYYRHLHHPTHPSRHCRRRRLCSLLWMSLSVLLSSSILELFMSLKMLAFLGLLSLCCDPTTEES